MPRTLASYTAIAAAVEVVSEGRPRRRIQLLPAGAIHLRDGRGPFFLPAESMAAVVEATRAHAGRADIMIDYDHQSFFGAVEGVGGRAEAAGWIDAATLEAAADGIWADVAWTQAAHGRLLRREYRYLSPLFTFDPETRQVRCILNAGLTNTPAITELAAVASRAAAFRQPPQEDDVSISRIAGALGLPADATEEQVLAAAAACKAGADATAAVAAAAQKLGLKADAGVDDLVAAAARSSASRPNPAEYVPIGAVKALQDEVAALKSSIDGDKALQAVAAALAAGKISPAMKNWAVSYAAADLAGFEGFVAAAPVIVAAGEQFAAMGAAAAASADGLSADERAVAASMGISAESYIAARKEGN